MFEELGLVFELSPGDVIIFRSDILTHYNLHYLVTQGSLVVHSDCHLKNWTEAQQVFCASSLVAVNYTLLRIDWYTVFDVQNA